MSTKFKNGIDADSNIIKNVATPIADGDAVNKLYVDNLSTNWHSAVNWATFAVLPNTPTYNAGSADQSGGYGIGAYLESSTNTRLSVDGHNAVVGERFLVKNQVDAKQNGIYYVATVADQGNGGGGGTHWKLTRATDDDNHIAGQVRQGDAVSVISGSNGSGYAGQSFIMSATGSNTDGTIKIGTDDITWTAFSGVIPTLAPHNTVLAGDSTGTATNAPTFRQIILGDLNISSASSASPAGIRLNNIGAPDAAVSFGSQNITNAGTIAGTTITASGASITIGTASTTTGTVVLKNSTNVFTTTITPAAPASNSISLTIPAVATGSSFVTTGDSGTVTSTILKSTSGSEAVATANIQSGAVTQAKLADISPTPAQASAGVYKITTDIKGRVLTTASAAASDVSALASTSTLATIASANASAAAITASSQKITNLADPTASSDAATKSYVDRANNGRTTQIWCSGRTPEFIYSYTLTMVTGLMYFAKFIPSSTITLTSSSTVSMYNTNSSNATFNGQFKIYDSNGAAIVANNFVSPVSTGAITLSGGAGVKSTTWSGVGASNATLTSGNTYWIGYWSASGASGTAPILQTVGYPGGAGALAGWMGTGTALSIGDFYQTSTSGNFASQTSIGPSVNSGTTASSAPLMMITP